MAEGIMAELGKSVTGNVESALLKIEDDRGTKALIKPSAGIGKSRSIATLAVSGLKMVAKATQDKMIIKMSEKILSAKPDAKETDSTKYFHVQFNPSELAIYGRCEEVQKSNAQAEGAHGTSDSALKPQFLELSLNLIFDHVNTYDAFLFNKMTMGMSTAGVTNAASAASSANGKTWSVQPEVEGLLAALRNPETRKVTFAWNDFSFQGLLNDVAATYTMFSVSGRPIRARVELRIRQDLSEGATNDWIKNFEAVFGDQKDQEPNRTSSYVRTQQKMGSLLNLDL